MSRLSLFSRAGRTRLRSADRPASAWRGLAVATAVVVGASGLTAPAVATPPDPADPSRATDLFDDPGARLGAHVSLDAHNGWEEYDAYRGHEQKWRRKADLVRVFADWEMDSIFTAAQRRLASEGRTLVVSWNSYGHGRGIRWEDVYSGAYDDKIDEAAAEVIDFELPILFAFQHEPDNQLDQPHGEDRAGSPAEFCRAYRYVVDRFRAAEVQNATYGVILMAWTARTDDPEPFYCGDDHVEWLGVDGYNWYGCGEPSGPWTLPKTIFGDWYFWARSHDRPLVVAEWGTGEDQEVKRRKAHWIRELRRMVKDWPEIKGVLIYHTARNRNCPRYFDTSRSSKRAYIRMGTDPYFAPYD